MNSLSSLLVIVLACLPTLCFAADVSPDKPDFSKLRNQRLQIIGDVESAKTELRKIEDNVKGLPLSVEIDGYLKRAQNAVEDIRAQIETEKKQKAPNTGTVSRLEQDLKFRQTDVERYQSDVDRKRNAEKESERLQGALKAREKELFEIESQISEALARDVVAQKFKSQISLYFAVLVGFMILCFFGVAFYDQAVRQTIFSGQAGMQFVTLFSLIIAIILFGITGILGDKELAALLGGLSGYILGRYNHSERSNPSAVVPTTPPNPSLNSAVPPAGGALTS